MTNCINNSRMQIYKKTQYRIVGPQMPSPAVFLPGGGACREKTQTKSKTKEVKKS